MPCGQTNGYRPAQIMQVSADRSAYSTPASFLTFPVLHRDRWSYLTASRKSRYTLAPWHCELGRQDVCRWIRFELDWGAIIHMIRFGGAMYTDLAGAHWQLTIGAAFPMARWRRVLLRNLQHRLGITLLPRYHSLIDGGSCSHHRFTAISIKYQSCLGRVPPTEQAISRSSTDGWTAARPSQQLQQSTRSEMCPPRSAAVHIVTNPIVLMI
jgi:hypothetical protein